jgi:hypothetical protein
VSLAALALACAAALGSSACASAGPALRPLPEDHPALRALPAAIHARLARIWRYQRETHCARPGSHDQPAPGYTMEPPPSGGPENGPIDCEQRIDASERLAIDLTRIYGGCEACTASCEHRLHSSASACARRCDLGSLADYDAHVRGFAQLFSDRYLKLWDLQAVIEPLPDPPIAGDQRMRCDPPSRSARPSGDRGAAQDPD